MEGKGEGREEEQEGGRDNRGEKRDGHSGKSKSLTLHLCGAPGLIEHKRVCYCTRLSCGTGEEDASQ